MGDELIKRAPTHHVDGTEIKPNDSEHTIKLRLKNDDYLEADNAAGTEQLYLIKATVDNEGQVGVALITGSIEAPVDGGIFTLFDMAFSDSASAGDVNGPYFKLDGNNMLYIIAEADGAGGSQNPKVVIDCSLHMKEITTPTAKSGYCGLYTSTDNKLHFQDGAGSDHDVQLTNEAEGEMYIFNSSTPIVIETADTPIMVRGCTAGNLSNFTFNAGSTGAITAFSDGTGKVNVASAAHGLTTGDCITIRGTTNYNGLWEVTVIDAGNFSIPDTWVANDGASDWDEGSHLIAGTGAAGNYTMNFQVSGSEAGAAGSDVMCRIAINNTLCNKCVGERKLSTNDLGNLPGTASLTIADGDKLYFTIQSTGTNNITIKHGNLNLKR